MTLRHFRIFLAVYEEMSITRAAQKIHMAQPSVSLAIRELEDHYQVQLFERLNRRLFITEKGELFYHYVSDIMQMVEEVETSMSQEESAHCINLGSSITIGSFVVPRLIERLHREYPAQEVKVRIQNSHQIIQSVLQNELDLGLVEGKVKNEQLLQVPFMKDRLCFICGREHPLAEKKNVKPAEICEYPLLMREVGSATREITDGLFKSYQMKPQIAWESVSNQALLNAVQTGFGITVLPERLAGKALSEGSIVRIAYRPNAFVREFVLIYHRKKRRSSMLEKLIAMVQELDSEP